jgi:multidrug resistance efflux pump
MYFSSNNAKQSEGTIDTIFDMTSGTMTEIDHQKREYWRSTFEEREASRKAGERLRADHKALQEELEKQEAELARARARRKAAWAEAMANIAPE